MPRKKFIVTTPYPTVEEVAAIMGVSKTRLKRLRAIMEPGAIHRDLRTRVPAVRSQSGATSLFEPRAFADLVTFAQIGAQSRIRWLAK